MNIEELIGKGYFPIELPPAFNTKKLGDNASLLKTHFDSLNKSEKKKYRETISSVFSTPKVGLSRRLMGIPNPIHQIELCSVIMDNWDNIQDIFEKSSISASSPIDDETGERALTTKLSFGEFKDTCLEDSFDKKFELKTDISKYYPNIYTHSIPWAIHTKEIAKAPENRNNFKLYGNLLDKAIRGSQSGQTKGIPIGPDTSRVISEILGCTFDHFLQEKFSLTGFRFVDDCYFYFNSQAEAERVFKFFQSLLTDYSLDINEQKTEIKKLPYPFVSDWSVQLATFYIRHNEKGQKTDIKNFVSLAFKLTLENPNDSVLKFAIRKLIYSKIFKSNWHFFESLLFKIGISEPVTLPDICRFLLTYKKWVNKRRLKKFIHQIIDDHIYRGHHYEVAWALWIAKSFKVKINKPQAKEIFESSDIISIIIAFDLLQNNLIDKSIETDHLKNEFTEDGLINDWWLLVYEATFKGWITPNNQNLISESPYFSKLKDENVFFYDPERQLDQIVFKKPKDQQEPEEIEAFESYKFLSIEYF